MKTLRGRLLVDGKLLLGTLTWANGRIERVETEGEIGGLELPVIAPGFVDLHVHGFGGFDPIEDVDGMARALARAGTTAFQPTLFPAAPGVLGDTCASLAARIGALKPGAGARVVGLHLEGPFVNPRAAGALPPSDLATPSTAALRAILGSASGDRRAITTMTIAPELPGAAELIDELARCGVRVSLGHSRATAAQARAAARSGACGATHLFNAMAPLHHREVGLAGFALTDGALFAEIIGDLVHVGPEAIELALRARSPRGLCLVSDALRGAGTGCDVFHWHGRDHVIRDGAAYYPPRASKGAASSTGASTSAAASSSTDSDASASAYQLAGSAMSQLEMVRLLTSRGVVGLPEALAMASETPARALGREREFGALRAGLAADFVVLRGPKLRLESVHVAGEAQF